MTPHLTTATPSPASAPASSPQGCLLDLTDAILRWWPCVGIASAVLQTGLAWELLHHRPVPWWPFWLGTLPHAAMLLVALCYLLALGIGWAHAEPGHCDRCQGTALHRDAEGWHLCPQCAPCPPSSPQPESAEAGKTRVVSWSSAGQSILDPSPQPPMPREELLAWQPVAERQVELARAMARASEMIQREEARLAKLPPCHESSHYDCHPSHCATAARALQGQLMGTPRTPQSPAALGVIALVEQGQSWVYHLTPIEVMGWLLIALCGLLVALGYAFHRGAWHADCQASRDQLLRMEEPRWEEAPNAQGMEPRKAEPAAQPRPQQAVLSVWGGHGLLSSLGPSRKRRWLGL